MNITEFSFVLHNGVVSIEPGGYATDQQTPGQHNADVMSDREKRRALWKELGGDPLQTLKIRRYRETVKITLPEFDDNELVWYVYSNDTFNACVRDRAAIVTSTTENLAASDSIIIHHAPDGAIVHLMVLEVTNWLYSHRLYELCRLPGLPEEVRAAIEKIKEEPWTDKT